jgi:Fe2+ transport system protein FeoA
MTPRVHLRLIDVPAGSNVRIRHLRARPEVSTRLRELGFCENVLVRCVLKSHGNIICEICNTRIGLSGHLAGNIYVSGPE